MTSTERDRDQDDLDPKVPTERPDPKAASRDPNAGAEDRPGFDLGGTVDDENATGVGSNTIPGGPMSSPAGGELTGNDPTGGSGRST